jgi:hypothetical protein
VYTEGTYLDHGTFSHQVGYRIRAFVIRLNKENGVIFHILERPVFDGTLMI